MSTAVPAFFLPGTFRTFFFLTRNGVLPLSVLLALYLLPQQFMFAAMIVGGQAHFLMAYLYQYRAGKMSQRYLLLAFSIATLFGMYFFISGAFFPLYFLVSLFFGIHFVIDEVTLHDESWSFMKVSTVVGFVVLFMAFVIHLVFPILYTLFAILTFNAVGVLVRLMLYSQRPSPVEWYLWFLEALIVLMVFAAIPIPFMLITSFVVILHFTNWMVGYGVRLRDDVARRRNYWLETVVSFVGIGILYVLFSSLYEPLFNLFFELGAYYAWAIAHIVLSFSLLAPRWG